MNNEHGMPIYVEIHKGHRSGDLNFGVLTGQIEEFSHDEMNELRTLFCCVIHICEDAFRRGLERRYPAAMAPKDSVTK